MYFLGRLFFNCVTTLHCIVVHIVSSYWLQASTPLLKMHVLLSLFRNYATVSGSKDVLDLFEALVKNMPMVLGLDGASVEQLWFTHLPWTWVLSLPSLSSSSFWGWPYWVQRRRRILNVLGEIIRILNGVILVILIEKAVRVVGLTWTLIVATKSWGCIRLASITHLWRRWCQVRRIIVGVEMILNMLWRLTILYCKVVFLALRWQGTVLSRLPLIMAFLSHYLFKSSFVLQLSEFFNRKLGGPGSHLQVCLLTTSMPFTSY